MKIIEENLNGLKLIEVNLYQDNRGFFCERFSEKFYSQLGITKNFVQDNNSYSKYGVIRGLHYQRNPNQAKLVSCISGEILDVAVDLRPHSPYFGKHYATKLSQQNGRSLYIPAGFAHGFSVLSSEGANILYKVDGYYNKDGEGGIIYNDSELNINWQIDGNPIISEKDIKLETFASFTAKKLSFDE